MDFIKHKIFLITLIFVFSSICLFANSANHKSDISQFIQNIPKAELHLHIEGTLEPELLFKLARKNHVSLPYASVEEVKKAYQFTDLQSFLNVYYQGMSVLKTEQDFYDLTWAYLEKAKEQNIVHVEIFFDPQAHLANGIEFSTVMNGINKALVDAKNKLNITSNLILCFLRDKSPQDAMSILEMARPYKNIIIAVGLDSAEVNNPPVKFKAVFDRARAYGFKTVAHAGEEGPPEYVIQALDILKVSRVDHGVRSLESNKLISRLVAERIPLTVCPISNIKLKVFQSMNEHPLKKMLEKKLVVTINSDDPAYFGGYLNDNYYALYSSLKLSRKDIYTLAKNSFEASFVDSDLKAKYIAELDNYYHSTLHN